MDVKSMRDSADIKRVCESIGMPVKKMGSSYFVKCPEHQDDNPSAFFKEGDNYIDCAVCSKNINAIDVIMQYKDIPFKDAINELAQIEGISIKGGKNNYKIKKPLITPSDAQFLGIKSIDGYERFLNKNELKQLIKAHIITKENNLKLVSSVISIDLTEELGELERIKQLYK